MEYTTVAVTLGGVMEVLVMPHMKMMATEIIRCKTETMIDDYEY
jgi:hypothetical protein